MSYPALYAVNVLLSAGILAALARAGEMAQRAGSHPDTERCRRQLRLAALIAVGLLVVKAGNAWLLARLGWVFADSILTVHLPLVTLPCAALVVASRWRAADAASGLERSAAQATWLGAAVWAAITAGGVFAEETFLRRPTWLAVIAAGGLAFGLAIRAGARFSAATTSRLRPLVAAVATLVLLAATLLSWASSRLPGSFDLGALASADAGGGQLHSAGHQSSGGSSRSVDQLRGPRDRPADVTYTLVAQQDRVPATGGRERDALSFNGQVPGPEISARAGDLIEVVLRNKDIAGGVSVHWHGYDVPNAEDGVAGVTQNAVPIGGSHTYRFLAEQVGTFWYHSHQASSTQVDRGLYGALVVRPRTEPATTDLVVVDHGWRGPQGFLSGQKTFDPVARVETRIVASGSNVRLRLINTNNTPQRYRLAGTSFTVSAIDGTDLTGPTPLKERAVFVAGGGRYDLSFTMPTTPVTLFGLGDAVRLDLTEVPAPDEAASRGWPALDPARYGSPAETGLEGQPDRRFTMDIDRRVAWLDGRPRYTWVVNGKTYPRMPMYMVSEGDLVEVTFINRSLADHPIHLHGHHMQVLSRGGRRISGSPWSSDTLNAAPGETYVVRFRADNPGIWMDHCHNLQHAAQGFVMHVGYTGISTPYRIGADSGNQPE